MVLHLLLYTTAHVPALQEVDLQQDEAMPQKKQASSSLPSVPIPPQDRQHLLGQLPADLAPAFRAAADTLHNTADAQVGFPRAGDGFCPAGDCFPLLGMASRMVACSTL